MKTKRLTSQELLTLLYNGVKNNFDNEKFCNLCEDKVIHFHASKIGDCARKIQYDLMDNLAGIKPQFSQQQIAYLRDGHINEQIVREAFKGAKVEILKRQPMRLVFKSKQGDIIFVGTHDIFFVYNKVKYMLDVKSIGKTSWKNMQKGNIPKRYIWQLILYMLSEKCIDNKTKIYGFILAKLRDTSEMMPYPVDYKESEVKLMTKKAENIVKGLKENKLVDREHEDRKDSECMYCPHNMQCWTPDILA